MQMKPINFDFIPGPFRRWSPPVIGIPLMLAWAAWGGEAVRSVLFTHHLFWAVYWLGVASGLDRLPAILTGAVESAGVLVILLLFFTAVLSYFVRRRWHRMAVLSLVMFGALGTMSCSLINIVSNSPTPPRPEVYPTTAPLSPRPDGQMHEFHLTAGQFPWEFVKGRPTMACPVRHAHSATMNQLSR